MVEGRNRRQVEEIFMDDERLDFMRPGQLTERIYMSADRKKRHSEADEVKSHDRQKRCGPGQAGTRGIDLLHTWNTQFKQPKDLGRTFALRFRKLIREHWQTVFRIEMPIIYFVRSSKGNFSAQMETTRYDCSSDRIDETNKGKERTWFTALHLCSINSIFCFLGIRVTQRRKVQQNRSRHSNLSSIQELIDWKCWASTNPVTR